MELLEVYAIVMPIAVVVPWLVFLYCFCFWTKAGRKLRHRLFSTARPLINGESETGRRCQILDDKWKRELSEIKRIKLQRPEENCSFVCKEILRQLKQVEVVDAKWDIIVVVALQRSRVQDDAESAMERVGNITEPKDRVILLMFHEVSGSRTVEDITSILYQNPDVEKTLHVPYKSYMA